MMALVLAFWLVFVFLMGASIGSFLNVAIARLPLEKSLLWPNSRCGACLQTIRWYDNIPILAYLWLRGRCRNCDERYSMVYMLVELGTALAFVGLFLLEVEFNVHGWPTRPLWYPWETIAGYGWHALLMSLLIVASVCDLKSREIPLQLTLTGTLIGLVGAALMPWPWPHPSGANAGLVLPPPPVPELPWQIPGITLHQGVYAWPFWGPLPSWAGEGELLTGLLTGVCGALMGTFLCRTIGFVFSKGLGKDALGLGDADLMMMAGAFLGWQIVLVAFFVAVLPALIFGVVLMVVRRDNSLPFGPSLSIGVMVTCLAWEPIGAHLRPILFWGEVLLLLAGVGIALMFIMSFGMRLIRGKKTDV
jgi:leader peptidase (prepilin peptidase) / N-methyltransferase